MRHIDDDQLSLLALGAMDADPVAASHLQTCSHCRGELDALRRVVAAARVAPHLDQLSPPPARVWAAISAAIDQPGSQVAAVKDPVTTTPASRPTRGWSNKWIGVAAGFVVGALAAGSLMSLLRGSDVDNTSPDARPPGELTLAQAQLAPLGRGGIDGAAAVLDAAGGRILQVTFDAAQPNAGYREVWLLGAEDDKMVSLGVLAGTEARLTIPATLDLADYPVVDVSREPYDGDPTHSTDSISRGRLQP